MTAFRCWSVRNILDLYADGRLTDAMASRVRGHIAACADCREDAAELRAVPAFLGKTEKLQVPPGLTEAILKKLEAGEVAREPIRVRQALRLSPMQAAALVYAAALLGLNLRPGLHSQAAALAASSAAAPEARR